MQTLVTPYTNFSQILWGQYFPIPQKIVKKLIIYFCSKKIEIRFWTYIHKVARFYGEQDSQTLFSVSMISSRRHVLALTDIYRYDVLKSFRIFGARLERLFSFFFLAVTEHYLVFSKRKIKKSSFFSLGKIIFNFNLEDEIALFLISPATHPPTPTEKIVSRLKLSFNFNLVGSLT